MSAGAPINAADGSPSSGQQPAPHRKKHWLILFELPILLFFMLVFAVILGRQYYFTDEWIRQWGENYLQKELQLDLSLGKLEIGWQWPAGLVIRLDDIAYYFSTTSDYPLVAVGQLELWANLQNLPDKKIAVTGLILDQIAVNLEEELFTSSSSDDDAESDSGPFQMPELPSLPVDITLERLQLNDIQLAVFTPTAQARLEGISLNGQAKFAKGQISGFTGLQIGDSPEQPGLFSWQGGTSAQVKIFLDLENNHDSLAKHLSKLSIELQPDFKDSTIDLELAAAADLENPEIILNQLDLQLNRETLLSLTGHADGDLLNPQISLDPLNIHLPLAELGAWGALFKPGTSGQGALDITTDALYFGLEDLNKPLTILPFIKIEAHRAGLKLPWAQLQLKQLDLSMELKPANNHLTIQSQFKQLQLPFLDLQDCFLKLALELTPTALGQLMKDVLPSSLYNNWGPWPKGREEIKIGLSLNLDSGQYAQLVAVKKLALQINATGTDYLGKDARGTIRLNSREITYFGEGTGPVKSPFTLELTASRPAFDSFTIKQLQIKINNIITIDGHGGLRQLFSGKPAFDNIEVAIQAPDLNRAWQFFPQNLRPGTEGWNWRGQCQIQSAINGTLPLPTMTRLIKISSKLENGLPRLQPLFNYIDRGLPFKTSLRVTANDLRLEIPGFLLEKGKLDFQFSTGEENKVPQINTRILFGKINLPTEKLTISNGELNTSLRQKLNDIKLLLTTNIMELDYPKLLTAPQKDILASVDISAIFGGDYNLQFSVRDSTAGLQGRGTIGIVKPQLIWYKKAWSRSGLPGIDISGKIHLDVQQPQPTVIVKNSFSSSGKMAADLNIAARNGALTLGAAAQLEDFYFTLADTVDIKSATGRLPLKAVFYFSQKSDRLTLLQGLPLGDGVLSLQLSGENILRRPPRAAYYEQLRAYRPQNGLTIKELQAGDLLFKEMALDLSISDGIFSVDHLSFNTLGGDLSGTMDAQLTGDKALRLAMGLNFTGIDASTLLAMPTSEDTEINGNISLDLEKSAQTRNLNTTVNLTKIGRSTLDRFLLTLDPKEQNPSLLSTRKNLKLVTIKGLNLWVKYENLKMYLDYQTKIGIPGTPIAYNPIRPEILGSAYSLSEYLDLYLDPVFDRYLGPLLGWQKTGAAK